MAEGFCDLYCFLRPAGDEHFIANGKAPTARWFFDDHCLAV